MFSLVYGPWERVTTSHHGSQVPFPSAYTDSTFLSISAVPSNAVFWITYYWLNQIYHTNDKLETKKLQKMNSLRKQCTKLTEILESSPQ